jgi:hypothetical protein
MTKDDSFHETFTLFNKESDKLKITIDSFSNLEDLSVYEIVPIYYQIMTVTYLAKFMKQNFQNLSDKVVLDRINSVENMIEEKFNLHVHPAILSRLQHLIDKSMKSLQNLQKDSTIKSKEEIEQQAKLYEELRQTMSTKEFVEQYDKGLS